ncbi:hypothetical protein V6N13_120439 [Hibiscus sabdariffa]
MEVASLFTIILIISTLLFALIFKSIIQKRKTRRNLPPTPPALPIIGHLHLLKQPVHRTLDQLSQKYGPVLLLQFGTRKVLMVSSASAAEECFTKNDIIFANRPQLLSGKHMNYNYRTMGLAPYGDYWRNLRRLTALELFSTSRLAMSASIRQEEVELLLKELFLASAEKPASVELTSKLIEVVFNIMLRMISGKRFYGRDAVDKEAEEFRDIMREVMELNGSTTLNDFLPVLQWVDFLGLERRMKQVFQKLDKFLQSLVEEHRRVRGDSTHLSPGSSESDAGNKGTKSTLIDVMLSLQQTDPEFYTDETIKGVILVILVAGTETSSTTIEWAMSLLLNHPDVMYKAPLLIPHESSEDCMTFEWSRVSQEEIDMKEGTGITMPKAEPLVALCSPRSGMLNLLAAI